MKKLIIPLFLIIVLCLGCGKKGPLTSEGFQKKMASEGFTIQDATNQFPKETISSVHLAINDNYQMEFYVLLEEENAKKGFAANKENFVTAAKNTKAKIDTSKSHKEKYAVIYDGFYHVVSRVNDTFIYVVAAEKHQSQIDKQLKMLGY